MPFMLGQIVDRLRAHFLQVSIAIALASGFAMATPAQAQSPVAPAKPQMKEDFCPGLVAGKRPPVTPASLRMAALAADQVRITYIGHSTFLIESPKLVRI